MEQFSASDCHLQFSTNKIEAQKGKSHLGNFQSSCEGLNLTINISDSSFIAATFNPFSARCSYILPSWSFPCTHLDLTPQGSFYQCCLPSLLLFWCAQGAFGLFPFLMASSSLCATSFLSYLLYFSLSSNNFCLSKLRFTSATTFQYSGGTM